MERKQMRTGGKQEGGAYGVDDRTAAHWMPERKVHCLLIVSSQQRTNKKRETMQKAHEENHLNEKTEKRLCAKERRCKSRRSEKNRKEKMKKKKKKKRRRRRQKEEEEEEKEDEKENGETDPMYNPTRAIVAMECSPNLGNGYDDRHRDPESVDGRCHSTRMPEMLGRFRNHHLVCEGRQN